MSSNLKVKNRSIHIDFTFVTLTCHRTLSLKIVAFISILYRQTAQDSSNRKRCLRLPVNKQKTQSFDDS